MIPIHRAHFHWDTDTKQIVVHEFLTAEDKQANQLMSDTGASWAHWKELPADRLVDEMCQLALDLIVAKNFDAQQVFKEFLKVDEFRRAGAKSFYLARVFSFVEDGQASENLDRWAV
jgi:hypothetical protein